MIGIGVLGLGSVFLGSYKPQVDRLQRAERVQVRAVYDPEEERRHWVAERYGVEPDIASAMDLIHRDDVDLVLIYTSMLDHGPLAIAALEAGKHVLVEKPMATSLDQARRMLEIAADGRSRLLCAPHVLLAPTYREMWEHARDGAIGDLHQGRARYGWSGPWWGQWFYRPGGGSLFDLGAYNITAICGFFGSAKRVTSFMTTRIPQRTVDGQLIDVEVDDNVQILIDHGAGRISSIMTGFTLQKYRNPAIEVYGSTGTMNMLGHDWAPEGYEVWSNDRGVWEVHPETHPDWHWTSGFDHLIDQLESGGPTLTTPEQAYHVLEIMLGAKQSAAEGRAVDIESEFPQPDYSPHPLREANWKLIHDPRSAT